MVVAKSNEGQVVSSHALLAECDGAPGPTWMGWTVFQSTHSLSLIHISARSAWIETGMPTERTIEILVALRKECVD